MADQGAGVVNSMGSGAGGAKSLSQHRFGKYAESYVASKTHAQGQELDRLLQIARTRASWRMLDVATGGGHTALKFAPCVASVVATDITPAMLDQAQAFITGQGIENVEFRLADAEDLPFDDGLFDLVTCRIAVHHFPDAALFLSEAARVLVPGGLLLVQDQVVPEDPAAAEVVNAFERLRDPSHNWSYAESAWLGLMAGADLDVEHREQVRKTHELLPWAERQECSIATIRQLVEMVEQAPTAVTDWMQPREWGTPQATFVGRHILVAARKESGRAGSRGSGLLQAGGRIRHD